MHQNRWLLYAWFVAPDSIGRAYRIDYKLCLLTYKTLTNQQPTYLYNSLSFPSHSVSIRSSDSLVLSIPYVKSSLGKRAFSVIGPRLWNSFPTNHCFVFDEDGCTWKTSFSWLCRRTTCWYQIRWIRPWKLICKPREMHCLWHKYPKSVPKMWSSFASRERKKLLQIVPWQVAYIQAESDKNFCLFV